VFNPTPGEGTKRASHAVAGVRTIRKKKNQKKSRKKPNKNKIKAKQASRSRKNTSWRVHNIY
jgi:hypothetical protein